MYLSFNAYDKKNDNHSFTHNAQTIIVDNSVPSAPTFSVSQTSNSVTVSSWSSYDDRSNGYTNVNTSSGINGIKNYTAILKNPDNSVKETKLIDATGDNYYTFTGLLGNTNYKASVTANDLAGNISTTETTVITAPAAPTLSPAVSTSCSISLSWNAPSGAGSYKLYNSSNSALIATTDATSYTVTGLSPGTSYSFYVKAFNNSGAGSPGSNVVTVSTQAIPTPSF